MPGAVLSRQGNEIESTCHSTLHAVGGVSVGPTFVVVVVVGGAGLGWDDAKSSGLHRRCNSNANCLLLRSMPRTSTAALRVMWRARRMWSRRCICR